MKLEERIVVLDTETGGLNPLEHSILSIGLIDWTGKHQLEIYVKEPEIFSHPKSMAVNRIDLDWVEANGVTPLEAVKQVEKFLDGLKMGRPLMIVGHNIAFDIAYMRRLYTLAGEKVPRDFSHRTIDTHTLLWALANQDRLPRTARSSDGAFRHFDIAPPEHLRHTALGDAVATLDLVRHLLPMFAD